MIQCDQNNLYVFSHKDEQIQNKYRIKDNYETMQKSIVDELVINNDCFSTFDGTEIVDTVITM